MNQGCMSFSNYQLECCHHLARLLRCRRRCCAFATTSNCASHDNYEKINSWFSFLFCIAAGALLLESLTAEDIKKLEIIKGSVLKSAENRETRKERVKKYLSWVRMSYQFISYISQGVMKKNIKQKRPCYTSCF